MEFQEDFIQAVWKYQYFDKSNLTTTDGLPLEIKKIGYHNIHEGPDFLEAHIRIGPIEHHGHIEIHKVSSNWIAHDHSKDKRYQPVILHVVWNHDRDIQWADGKSIPTLELNGKIHLDVIRNYEKLSQSREEILCSESIAQVPEIVRYSMLEKTLIERLEKKSQKLDSILKATKNDWEEATFRWLFYCFGFKTNSETMLLLSEKISQKALLKIGGSSQAIRSIFLGMAGLLPENFMDEESELLQREFAYQKHKLKLTGPLSRSDWKFLGVRPPNFPTIRLVQLSELTARQKNLFAKILHEVSTYAQFKDLMRIQLPIYWRHHHQFGHANSRKQSEKLAESTLHLLAINFVVPLWYAYGKFTQDSIWKEKCIDFLLTLPAEENRIIRKFGWVQVSRSNAFDSQALIGLYNDYCHPKQCLQCKIGQNLLKPEKK